MDRPFAFDAKGCGAACAVSVALRIRKITERPIDGAQAIGAAGDGHPAEGCVPLVAGIIGVQAADIDGAGAHRRRIVGDTEMHCLEAAAILGDALDIGHPQRGLDQRLEADTGGVALGLLDLVDQRIDHIEVVAHPDFGHQDGVQPVTGLLHDIDHVAVHVVGIEAVDPHRDGPVDVVQGLDDVPAGLLLLWGRHRVLAIEEHIVDSAVGGLVDHAGVRSGDRQFAALQTLARLRERMIE